MYSIKIKLDVVLGYKGMTLKELSEKTGLTISNLSNIKNNPILQSVYFTPVNARYVQLKATRMIHDGEPIGLAEIGIQ